jgi:hypothetical protein
VAALVVAQVESRLSLANSLTWLGVSLDGTLSSPLDAQLMTSALALLVPAVVTSLQDNKEALDTLRTALVERCSAGEIKKVRGGRGGWCRLRLADTLTERPRSWASTPAWSTWAMPLLLTG